MDLQQKIEEDASDIAALQRKIRELEVSTPIIIIIIIIHVHVHVVQYIYISYNSNGIHVVQCKVYYICLKVLCVFIVMVYSTMCSVLLYFYGISMVFLWCLWCL